MNHEIYIYTSESYFYFNFYKCVSPVCIVAALYFLRFFRNMFWHTTQTLLIIVRENGNNSHQLSVSSVLLLLL